MFKLFQKAKTEIEAKIKPTPQKKIIPMLFERKNIEKIISEDLKKINADFIENTDFQRNATGMRLITVYTDIENTFKELDPLNYMNNFSFEKLEILKINISKSTLVLNLNNPVETQWHERLL